MDDSFENLGEEIILTWLYDYLALLNQRLYALLLVY